MRILTLLGAILLALPAIAADSNSKDIFARHWKVSQEFTLAVAQAMPAEAYDFKPKPEEMSFGQLMVHIADENSQDFARAAKTKPLARPDASDKQTAIAFLAASFEKCAREFDALKPDQLDQVLYQVQGQPVTGWEALWFAFTHTAHTRGQTEVYLRVKGIKPPDYRF